MVKSIALSLAAHFIIIFFALVSFKTTTIRPQREMAHDTEPVVSRTIKAAIISDDDVKFAIERQKQSELTQQLAQNKRKAENLAAEKKALQLKKELEIIKKQKIFEEAAAKKAASDKVKIQQETKKIQEKMRSEQAHAKQKLAQDLAHSKVLAEKLASDKLVSEKLAAQKRAEARQAAEQQEWVDGEINKFATLLESKVVQNRSNLFAFSSDLNCDINIKLTEQGDLLSAQIVRSSGNHEYDDFQLKAIAKSAPFNMPEDNAILAKFQDIILNFTNDGDQASEIS